MENTEQNPSQLNSNSIEMINVLREKTLELDHLMEILKGCSGSDITLINKAQRAFDEGFMLLNYAIVRPS